MEPLELKADLLPCWLMTGFAVMICLPLFLMALVSGHWMAVLLMLTPVPSLTFWWWRRGRSLTFCHDHLEDRTRFSVNVIPYTDVVAEFRLHDPRSARGTGPNAHLPILSLRKNGRLLLMVPRNLYRKADIQQADSLLQALAVPRRYLY